MTSFHQEERQCPYCLSEERVTIWDRMDAQLDPDLKDRLLRKKLQILDCSNCGRQFALAEPLLYIDREAKLVIYVTPHLQEQEEEKNWSTSLSDFVSELAPHLPQGSLEGWTLRFCATYNDLIEKVHLFQNGFDDRYLEVVKLAMASRMLTDEQRDVESIHFLTGDEQRMIFIVQDKQPSEVETESAEQPVDPDVVELSTELYTNAVDLLKNRVPANGQWLLINRDYALRLVNAQLN